jgi:Asp-tRNA(Asn)/Glu-tRNA(Gln) amidotransferase A subunit family amidase
LDAKLAAGGEAGPLAGLPLLVKDITDVGGMRTTYGSLLYADAPAAPADALVVARLRGAGAIVVGKTNTPEFACAGFTTNRVFGATRNPWNRDRTPGGSSGGSAAAIATGMACIATATDTGGSIRIPASYCGLVGLKPTNGTISRDPAARATDWIDLTTDGPLGATVDDVRLQFLVLSDTTPSDAFRSHESRRVSRLLVLERWTNRGRLPAEDAALFDEAVSRLSLITGLDPEPRSPSEMFPGMDVGDDWAILGAPELLNILGGQDRFGAVRDRLHPTTAGFAEWGSGIGLEAYLAARRRRFSLADLLRDALGDRGLIVSPTMCGDAVAPEGPEEGSEVAVYDNVVGQNLAGFPAISLPAGLRTSGVPFGLQLTAAPYHEGLLLDLAEAWEKAHPWPSVAPGYMPLIS